MGFMRFVSRAAALELETVKQSLELKLCLSIPTPPSLHPLVTQTSSDMIGAALKQELS